MDYEGYCIRVDALDGYADKVRMLSAATDYQSIIAVSHQGSTKENPHYHIVIKTQVKDQALRVRMKKIFDKGKGNGHMSIKPWDGKLDAISYLFHEDENAELLCRHNVSDETIGKAKERNREVQEKVKEAKGKASWKLEDEVFQIYEGKPDTDEYTIAKAIILKSLRGDKYMPNDFLLKSMAKKIKFRLQNGNVADEEQFANNEIQRIYRLEYEEYQRWVAEGV